MRLILLVLLLILITLPAAAEAPPGPAADARCAVCGMFVSPYANWIAALETPDGEYLYFDGPKDLFKYFDKLGEFQPGISPDKVQLYVTEYYTTRLVPATEVFFVIGSDVMGPMGEELVPVAGRDSAETFRLDHSGKALQRFDGNRLIDVTEAQ